MFFSWVWLALIFFQGPAFGGVPLCEVSERLACEANLVDRKAVQAVALEIHEQARKVIPGGDLKSATILQYVNYLKTYELELERRTGLSSSEVESVFLQIKSWTIEAVEGEEAAGRIPAGKTSELRDRLLRARFLRASEFAQQGNEEDVFYSMIMSCGFGLPQDNAFTFPSHGWVVVCPARLVRMAMEKGPRRMRSVFRGLAHELGHQIDWSYSPALYGGWRTCTTENWKNLKQPLERYLSELSADYWAAGAAILYAKQSSDKNILNQVYGDLCGVKEAGIQASGGDRIEIGLATHPYLLEKLNCPQTQTCSIQ